MGGSESSLILHRQSTLRLYNSAFVLVYKRGFSYFAQMSEVGRFHVFSVVFQYQKELIFPPAQSYFRRRSP